MILKSRHPFLKNRGDLSGLLLGTAFLIEAETIWGKYSPGLIREAEELLKSIDPGLYLYEQAVLWSQIGLVNSIRVNSRRGYWACQKAYLLANQLGDPLLQAGALTHALTCLTALGEFRQAEQLLKEMDPLLWRFNQGEIRSFYFLSKILFLIFRGETEASLDLCEIFLEEAERQGLAQVYPLILFYKQMALVSARQYDPARQIHRQLLELALSMNNGFLSAVTKLFAGVSASGPETDPRPGDWLIRRQHCSPTEIPVRRSNYTGAGWSGGCWPIARKPGKGLFGIRRKSSNTSSRMKTVC